MGNFAKGLKNVTITQLLATLEASHNFMQKEARHWRDDLSLNDVLTKDVHETSLDRMIDITTELKTRIGEYKIKTQSWAEEHKIKWDATNKQVLCPFEGKDGKTYISIYVGGDAENPNSYIIREFEE